MSARFGAAGQVAIVGYAHSPVSRRAETTLGALTVETVLEAIADAGLNREQIDGFTTGAIFPLKNWEGPRHIPAIPGRPGLCGILPPATAISPASFCHAARSA